ncbi:hypothetical protein K435DRAFT_783425 [Dendrothele bispora CBS 962.96]|uniref:CFEM domain-containing protein n=1 Tax=Dendrothele bispora (strain CBS 962.96) TaxID=1314807 RepID=A0A4S8LA31_DENBC|nr:hypothetical protein K435DRAFT_783425 [Dendrothele bispora CBS 962.96]
MRYSFFVSTALVSLASASSVSLWRRQFPGCATSCLANADTGNCVASDNACLCRSQSFVDSTTQCIESSCSGNDLQTALTDAQMLCAAVGVTLTSTPGSTPTSGGASTTVTSPATSSGSSGMSASSPTGTSSGSSATGSPDSSGFDRF